MLKVLNGEQEKWPLSLDGILFAFRTTRHKSTGVTPFQIMYAREPVLPLHCINNEQSLILDVPVDLDKEEGILELVDLHENLKQIKNIQCIIHEEVEKNIKKSQLRKKKDYEKRHKNQIQFNIGDEVFVYNLRRADRKGDKGKSVWDGPYEVIEIFFDKGLYQLKQKNGEILRTKHHGSNMKLFEKRSEIETPKKKCDEVSDIKSEPLKIVEVLVSKSNSFTPTNSKWRTRKCSLLKIEDEIPYKKGFAIRKKKLQLGKPIKVDKMEGDGNCLFRALSQEVCLSQEFYKILRQLAINTLLKAEYRNAFDAYISKLVIKYISDSKMDTDHIWGTDVEIYALATALDTPIVVYYKPPEALVFSWYFYKPLLKDANNFKLMEIKENDQIVYLQNTGVHYDRVVTVG
ncbi:uncharacterized protein LOC136080718 [Hydra vulgaris]|uniref:Uncharacterized protein LOC136080718 n=1 Tax=Hydra vulgaris TaxID=6087 RepID=A0ABM4BX62_HYDVU